MIIEKICFYGLVLLGAALLVAPGIAVAQDLEARDFLGNVLNQPAEEQAAEEPPPAPDKEMPVEEETTAAPQEDLPEEPAEEPRIYPEKYIAEMNGFYDYCAEDSYMSKNYDCGCMAEKYIDKRMELGDQAGSAEILDAINQECAFDQATVTTSGGGTQIDLSNLTDEQIEEIEQVHQGCSNNYRKSRTFDCDCVAAQFMEKRIERGPDASYDVIMFESFDACPNVAGATGKYYQDCMTQGAPFIASYMSDEEFCECVANEFGKMYEEVGRGGSTRTNMQLKSHARSKCMNLTPNNPIIQYNPQYTPSR